MKRTFRSRNLGLVLWCALGLTFLGGPRLMAQDADPFALPADGGASAAAPAGDGAAPAAAPAAGGADTPANPAESPDAPPADPAAAGAGGGGGGDVAPPAEAGAPAAINPALDEAEQIDLIMQNTKFKLENEVKDPFKPLVEKKVAMPVVPVAPRPMANKPAGPPPPPPVKPIQIFVQGVCGNDADRLAMIVFENKPLTVTKDQVVDGKFKVVDILTDKIVVYSNKEQMRRTFPIGGGKE